MAKRFLISWAAAMTFMPAVAYAESAPADVKVDIVDGNVKLIAVVGQLQHYCSPGGGRDACVQRCYTAYQYAKASCVAQPGDTYNDQLMYCLDQAESEHDSCQNECNSPCMA